MAEMRNEALQAELFAHRAQLAAMHHEIVLIGRTMKVCAQATLFMTRRMEIMSAFTDGILTKSTALAALANGLGEDTATFIGLKDETDTALQAVSKTIDAATSALTVARSTVTDAIEAHNAMEAPATDTTGALGSKDASGTGGGVVSTVAVVAATTSGASAIPVSTPAPVPAGSTVAGPGIADGTKSTAESTSGVLVLDMPTVANHTGGETLTVTAPAS